MENAKDLPDHLRRLRTRIDALWISPDPRLITPQNFNLIKEFCLSNRIAFYVPTVELVEQGAAAAVASSFDQIGRSAAQAAKDLLAGTALDDQVYPEKQYVALNVKLAADYGLRFSPGQIQKADKAIP